MRGGNFQAYHRESLACVTLPAVQRNDGRLYIGHGILPQGIHPRTQTRHQLHRFADFHRLLNGTTLYAIEQNVHASGITRKNQRRRPRLISHLNARVRGL